MPTGYEGFGKLGELVGGQVGTPGVYEDALKKGYSVQEQLEQARRARTLALIDAGRLESRQAVTPALLQAALGGDIEAQAALGAGVLGGNQTMNLGQLGDFQRPHFGQNVNAAQDALGAGDIPAYNKFNAAAEGKSYQPVRELGDAYVADGVALGDLDAIPTPESLSRIEENRAQAGAATTRANRAPAPRAPRAPSATIQKMQVAAMERDLGRPLTAQELADLAAGNLNIAVPADEPLGEVDVAGSPIEVRTEGFQSFNDIPDDARAQLREGVKTKFRNGQVWSLVRGQPTRVK